MGELREVLAKRTKELLDEMLEDVRDELFKKVFVLPEIKHFDLIEPDRPTRVFLRPKDNAER